MQSCLHLLVIFIALQMAHSTSFLTNVSIDDDSLDPLTGAQISYGLTNEIGSVGWNIGQTCATCRAQPDPLQAFNRTWHDSSTLVNGNNIPIATVAFTGVAVYVLGIIVSSCPETTFSLNNTRMFFEIDGTSQANYVNNASVGPEVVYAYNTTLFAKEDFAYGPHNITIMCGDGNPAIDSVCLLDRIIYTTKVDSDNSTSNVTNSTNPPPITTSSTLTPTVTSKAESQIKTRLSVPTIVGVVTGSALLFVLVAGAFYLRGRWRRTAEPATLAPFMMAYQTRTASLSGVDSIVGLSNHDGFEPPSYHDVLAVSESAHQRHTVPFVRTSVAGAKGTMERI